MRRSPPPPQFCSMRKLTWMAQSQYCLQPRNKTNDARSVDEAPLEEDSDVEGEESWAQFRNSAKGKVSVPESAVYSPTSLAPSSPSPLCSRHSQSLAALSPSSFAIAMPLACSRHPHLVVPFSLVHGADEAGGVLLVAKATAGCRQVEIDGREFSELWPRGSHTGYSSTCQCCGYTKNLTFLANAGDMLKSQEECRNRLLGWEMQCSGDDSEHKSTRKKLLVDFASY